MPKKPGTFPYLVSENLQTGARRIKRVEKLLSKNDKYAEAYRGLIEAWIQTGILKLTSLEELRANGPWTELPHHAVIREDRATTQVRPVFEGNAHDPGKKSTNDYLDPGVNVLPMINEIITDIRLKKYFVISDISKAFVQVQLLPEDQFLLAIRWPAEKLADGSYRYDWYRFMHLPWGIACASFVLNAAVRYLLRKYAEQFPQTKEFTDLLQINAYVDDIASTGNTIEETVTTADIAIKALAAGEMNLTKHRGYPPTIVEALGSEPTYDPYKILGCGFNPANDTLCVRMDNLDAFEDNIRITKRQAAGMVARIYDPLGWVTPATLEGKKLRQKLDLAHPKADWNFLMSAKETKKWHDFTKSCKVLKDFTIPRQLSLPGEIKKEYHVFTDASEIAIGAVMYCVSHAPDQVQVSLVTAKSKINPITKPSKAAKKEARKLNVTSQGVVEMGLTPLQTPMQINRMELNAALLGARLVETIRPRIGEDAVIHYWTDSQVTIQWIYKGPFTGVEFVDTRISKILKTTNNVQWRHCPGSDNPADLASRGCTPQKLLESNLWKNGPTWITNSSEWPQHSGVLSIYRTQGKYPMNKEDFTNFVFKIRDKQGNYYNDYNWRKCVLRYTAFLRFQKMAKKRYFPKCYDLRPRILVKPVFDPNNSYFKKPVGKASIKNDEFKRSELMLLRDMQRFYATDTFNHLSNNPQDIVEGLGWSTNPDTSSNLILSVGRQHDMLRKTNSVLEKPLIYIPYTNGSKDNPLVNPVARMLMIQSHLETGHG